MDTKENYTDYTGSLDLSPWSVEYYKSQDADVYITWFSIIAVVIIVTLIFGCLQSLQRTNLIRNVFYHLSFVLFLPAIFFPMVLIPLASFSMLIAFVLSMISVIKERKWRWYFITSLMFVVIWILLSFEWIICSQRSCWARWSDAPFFWWYWSFLLFFLCYVRCVLYFVIYFVISPQKMKDELRVSNIQK